MASSKDEKLKSLLKNVELPKPSVQFKAEVMDGIQALEEKESFADAELKTLLRGKALVNAPTSLAFQVLNKVRGQRPSATLYRPVISRKAWVGIAAFVVFLVVMALANGQQEAFVGKPRYTLSIAEYIFAFLSRYREEIFMSVAVAWCAIFLLVFDHWLSRKERSGA